MANQETPWPLQWRMDEMERQAKRLAEELAGAFRDRPGCGKVAPGLRALWLEDHIHALGRLELQFKALEYARQEATRPR